MPRGRPRKNKNEEDIKKEINKDNEINNKDNSDSEVPPNFSFLTYAQYEKLPCCERCHQKSATSLRNINLTYLTGMAPWHRKVSKEKIKLCDKCCKELNEKIDAWLINNGNGIKEKFEEEKEKEEEEKRFEEKLKEN